MNSVSFEQIAVNIASGSGEICFVRNMSESRSRRTDFPASEHVEIDLVDAVDEVISKFW